jgi:transcriptional regulator with XRE-family HTH domain
VPDISPDLGARLKIARQAKQLSLRSLAADLGVSAALLSQIELGHTQPSVSTLYALVSRLELSLDGLLGLQQTRSLASRFSALTAGDDSAESPIIRSSGQHPTIQIGNGVTWELIATVFGSEAEAVLATYEPGASSSADGSLMTHPGHEDAYLIEGELTLDLEGATYLLRAGDSFTFDSGRPHRYDNEGSVPARGVWVKEHGEA